MWKKVVAPTALVSVFWVLVSCGTSYFLTRVDEAQALLLNENVEVTQAAGVMQEDLWRLQAMLFEALESRDKGGKLQQRFQIEAKQLEDSFDRVLALAAKNASTHAEADLARSIGENFGRYRTVWREQFARSDHSPKEATGSIDMGMHLARAVAKPCEELSELAQRLTTVAFERRDRLRANVNLLRMAFVIVGPGIGILLGVWVARGLHHSISEINVTLRGASGDLQQEIGLVEVYPTDELGGLPALQQQVQYVSGRIKKVVEELQWTRREAVRSERLAAVGELAAGVAHEVRNPLTSVKLLIQAIERNQSPTSADKQRLQIVQQEIARIETTMQELLDYARPPKLRRVRHDVRDTLRRSLNLVAGRAQQVNVTIDEQLGAAPQVVDADPDQLQQVFINLVLNAIEAMSSGGGTLHVSVEDVPAAIAAADHHSAGGLLRIIFRDTGSGIRADVLERLFEPFVTGKERGIGLGLAISRQIMQEHGGRLTASNPPPCGAMFVAEVPLADGDGETDDFVRAGKSGRVGAREGIGGVPC